MGNYLLIYLKYIDVENIAAFAPIPSTATEYMRDYELDDLPDKIKAFTTDNIAVIETYKLMTETELKDFIISDITVPGEYPNF